MQVTFALFVGLAITLGFTVLVIAIMLLRGLVLSVLWGWFAVPIFHLPELSIPQAIGLSILVSMLCYQRDSNSKKETWEPFVYGTITLLAMLGTGYIVKGFL